MVLTTPSIQLIWIPMLIVRELSMERRVAAMGCLPQAGVDAGRRPKGGPATASRRSQVLSSAVNYEQLWAAAQGRDVCLVAGVSLAEVDSPLVKVFCERALWKVTARPLKQAVRRLPGRRQRLFHGASPRALWSKFPVRFDSIPRRYWVAWYESMSRELRERYGVFTPSEIYEFNLVFKTVCIAGRFL